MPNGHSGGFVISKTDLTEALTAVFDAGVIGVVFRNVASADVDASEVSGFMQGHPRDVVTVEEQDRSCYILHLGELTTWVMVGPDSPLFAELKRQHVQYLADHPRTGGLPSKKKSE